MSVYIFSDGDDAIYKKGQIKVDLDKTFSDNDNTIKIALESRIEELEKDVAEKDKTHIQLLEDIASGKIKINSLSALEDKIENLENNNFDKNQKNPQEEKKIKKPKKSKENIIYKYAKEPLIQDNQEPEFPKNNFYQNVNNPNINNPQGYNNSNNQNIGNITNNEIEMVVLDRKSVV